MDRTGGRGRPITSEAELRSLWHRTREARDRVAEELLRRRHPEGFWSGFLCSSPLGTATAMSALCCARRDPQLARGGWGSSLEAAVARALSWLCRHQQADGGWGDTPRSRSNLAATWLATAALRLAASQGHAVSPSVFERSAQYLQGLRPGQALVQRYGSDQTFAVPIRVNLALAGLDKWSQVPVLPFEAVVLPGFFWRLLRLGVVSYAMPALVAMGMVAAIQRGLPRWRRLGWSVVVPVALRRLQRWQPRSGGYLEAIPLTAFVVMALIAAGYGSHAVVENGLRFLLQTQRDDGSWPIDVNLSCWVTSLAVQALSASELTDRLGAEDWEQTVRWILACQTTGRHLYTGAEPGGWGWSHLPGAVPDVDDTSAALLALRPWAHVPGVLPAAERGLRWLIHLQNSDGGWPTFCRGWGKLPFDASAADLTAHALRALWAWRPCSEPGRVPQDLMLLRGRDKGALRANGTGQGWPARTGLVGRRRWWRALRRGVAFLIHNQQPDGSWVPLWFGNESDPREQNPLYGTARVLTCFHELSFHEWLRSSALQEATKRAVRWVVENQNDDGGWGSRRGVPSSVEETALALKALAPKGAASWGFYRRGLLWLLDRLETGDELQPSPIGLYFAKLWYSEELYPWIFSLGALVEAVRQMEGWMGPSWGGDARKFPGLGGPGPEGHWSLEA